MSSNTAAGGVHDKDVVTFAQPNPIPLSKIPGTTEGSGRTRCGYALRVSVTVFGWVRPGFGRTTNGALLDDRSPVPAHDLHALGHVAQSKDPDAFHGRRAQLNIRMLEAFYGHFLDSLPVGG